MRLSSLVILLSIFSCDVIIGQIDTYPLSEYKRPELHRTTMVIDGNFDSDNSFESNEEEDRSFQALDLRLNYQGFHNTKNTQKSISHFTNSDVYVDLEKEKNKIIASFSHQSLYSVKRFDSTDKFLGYRPNITINTDYNKDLTDPTRYVTLSMPIGIGKGRIEIVNDAWLATSILQALKQEGKLKREPTHEEISEIADEIARIKNDRVLDFRKKRIYELEEIYIHLIDQGLVEENTLSFAILYDAWLYEIYDYRRTGASIQTYISPRYSHNFGEDQANNSSGNWNIRYSNYKPINLKWGRVYSINVYLQSSFNSFTDFKSKTDQFKDNLTASTSGYYSINYYRSRRTYFSWDNSLTFSKILDLDYKRTNLNSQFRFVNWISPQVRLVGRTGLSIDMTNWEFYKRNIVSPTINVSIQYSIF